MTGALPLIAPLVAATLVVLSAVAGLPALLLASPPPQARNPAVAAMAGAPLQLVRSGQGRWFLNGQPIAELALARLLRRQRGSATELRFQPSARLQAAQVSTSLAWLRRESARPVALDLPRGMP